MRLYLVRHAESEGNLLRRFFSWGDHYPLTGKGERQAAGLASSEEAFLRGAGLFLAGPAERARRTAAILAEGAGVGEVERLDALREVDVGDLEGLHEDEEGVMDRFFGVMDRFRRGERDAGFVEGETLADILARCDQVEERLRRSGTGDVVAVSHCLFLCALIPCLTGQRICDYENYFVKKSSLTVLAGEPGAMRPDRLGDLSHLPPELQP